MKYGKGMMRGRSSGHVQVGTESDARTEKPVRVGGTSGKGGLSYHRAQADKVWNVIAPPKDNGHPQC